MPNLNVKAITKLTGLNEHTLRAWERRYGAVHPKRADNGRRVYGVDDVERLRILVQLQTQGHAIGRIAALPIDQLRQLVTNAPTEAAVDVGQSSVEKDIHDTHESIETALSRYDLPAIHLQLNRARHRFGAKVFVLDIIAPLMSAIGRLVLANEMSMAQEHALSAIVKCHLGTLFSNMQDLKNSLPSGRGPSFLITTMEGDLHDIGILISAIICASHGVDAYFLGPNMPALPLAEAAVALGTTHLLLGKSQIPANLLVHPPEVYLNELAARLPAKAEIWLGGSFEVDLNLIEHPSKFKMLRSLAELDRVLEGMNRLS